LDYLVEFWLGYNKLGGTFPSEAANLKYLLSINIQGNNFEGSIPIEWYDRDYLRLNVGMNQIKGRLPTEIAKMSELRYLIIHSNQFTGPLPTELWSMSKLGTFLDLVPFWFFWPTI